MNCKQQTGIFWVKNFGNIFNVYGGEKNPGLDFDIWLPEFTTGHMQSKAYSLYDITARCAYI